MRTDLQLDQDTHLDNLSHSINRQRDLSLQINDELDVHTGLLEGLDVDLENTSGRLGNARRQLSRVAKGAKEHGEPALVLASLQPAHCLLFFTQAPQ